MLRVLLAFQIFSVFLFAGCEDLFAGRKEIYNPVIEVSNLRVSTSKAVVKKAVLRQFTNSVIREEQENSFRFLFTIRSHSADILVHFTENSIEFEFLSCENLDYKVKNGKQLIHKNYNVWMRDLEAEISLELSFAREDIESSTANSDAVTSGLAGKRDGHDPGVMEGDTQIYVFRQKAMLGAMMTVSVGVNDRLVAQLKSSSYCMFKEKAGPITVNILQANMPIASVAVDQRPGELVFLSLDYKRGTLTEITRSSGLDLLKKYKEMPNLTIPKPNPAYVVGLMNPGSIDQSLMKTSEVLLQPDADHAVITFVGDYKKFQTIPVGIWTENKFLGSLNGHSLFQIKVAPGKHMFFGKYEHWSVLEAQVEAGKNYYAQVTISRGWTQAHVRIIPVKQDFEQSVIDNWMRYSEWLVFDEQNLKSPIKERMEAAVPFIEKAIEQVQANLQETRVLNVADSR